MITNHIFPVNTPLGLLLLCCNLSCNIIIIFADWWCISVRSHWKKVIKNLWKVWKVLKTVGNHWFIMLIINYYKMSIRYYSYLYQFTWRITVKTIILPLSCGRSSNRTIPYRVTTLMSERNFVNYSNPSIKTGTWRKSANSLRSIHISHLIHNIVSLFYLSLEKIIKHEIILKERYTTRI